MIKDKLKASLIHFIFSLIIVSLIIISAIYFWFPIDYLKLTSFKEIALIIISIDLVIGPLLTLVVFNKKKKSLRFDLAVIALFQLSALAYGTYTLFETHPMYLTFNGESFNLISAKDVQPENAKYAEYNISKLKSVKLAYVEMPTNYDDLLNVTMGNSVEGSQRLEQRTEFYKPYKPHADKVLENTLDTAKIFADKKISKETKEFLSTHNNIDDFVFLPLTGTSSSVIIVLDKKTVKPVGTINTSPWKYAKK